MGVIQLFKRQGWGPPLIILGGLWMLFSGGYAFLVIRMNLMFGADWEQNFIALSVQFMIFMAGVWIVRRGWRMVTRVRDPRESQ